MFFYANNTKVNYNWFKYGIGKEKKSGEGGQKGGHYTGRKENKEGKRMEWQGREKWKEYGDEGIRKLTRNERKEGLKKGMKVGLGQWKKGMMQWKMKGRTQRKEWRLGRNETEWTDKRKKISKGTRKDLREREENRHKKEWKLEYNKKRWKEVTPQGRTLGRSQETREKRYILTLK